MGEGIIFVNYLVRNLNMQPIKRSQGQNMCSFGFFFVGLAFEVEEWNFPREKQPPAKALNDPDLSLTPRTGR